MTLNDEMEAVSRDNPTQASPSTPTISVDVPGDAAAKLGGSPPPSTSRALRVVARQFVGAYYDDLNASPERVKRFYTEDSVFTIEDDSTPRRGYGRMGKQFDRGDEKTNKDDFYDSGPESPMRRLAIDSPTTSGTELIIIRRQKLFKNRLVTVVSTDVQTISGGNVLAVVLGTLTSNSKSKKDVTFMQSFVLGRRRTDSSQDSDSSRAEHEYKRLLGHVPGEVNAESPPSDFLDFVIVNEVFRRIDAVEKMSPAATAATVLSAAMSPIKLKTRNEGVTGGVIEAHSKTVAATPQKLKSPVANALHSPNPFNDESETNPHFASANSQFMSPPGFDKSQAKDTRPTSPDARAIPLPSPGLLSASRSGSSESRLKRSARRYDPREEDDDGARRILAFEQERGDTSPWHRDGYREDRADDQSRVPPSSRLTRDQRDPRRRMYSSASSSPAMSLGQGSQQPSPYGVGGNAHKQSYPREPPHAKRGLGFVERDPKFVDTLYDRSPQPARLVTLSERSDEGSQGAHSMSVSVSSQPSMSRGGSEDGDRESNYNREHDGGELREFPVDELEPVNLDDVRQVRHNRGRVSGHSSYRLSPVATPSRRRRQDGYEFRDERDFEYRARESYQQSRYPPSSSRHVPYTNLPPSYDSRGYVTRGYHSARASPVVSREGGARADYRRGGGVSRFAAASAAASPATSRQGSRKGPRVNSSRQPTYVSSFLRPPRRRFDSAPPSPSMGATRRAEFGAANNYNAYNNRSSRLSSAFGTRSSTYRVVGVGAHGETIVAQKPQPEEQLDVAVNYLSMLTAALHFTAAAVAFCVLVIGVGSNAKSSDRVLKRLNRIDEAVLNGRVPVGYSNADMSSSYNLGSYSHSGRTPARDNDSPAASSRGYSLPAVGVDPAPAPPKAPTNV